MKLYDTVNGVYISESEVEKTEIVKSVYAGEYDENQLEILTIEGNEVGDSTQLSDLKELGYAYFSGDSGSVIACSDGRHVDTIWNTGCWDHEADDTDEREVWGSRFESLKEEMDAREAYFESISLDAPDEIVDAYHEKHGHALEVALTCVDDNIIELYPEAMVANPEFPDMEHCIMDYVGDHINATPRSKKVFEIE